MSSGLNVWKHSYNIFFSFLKPLLNLLSSWVEQSSYLYLFVFNIIEHPFIYHTKLHVVPFQSFLLCYFQSFSMTLYSRTLEYGDFSLNRATTLTRSTQSDRVISPSHNALFVLVIFSHVEFLPPEITKMKYWTVRNDVLFSFIRLQFISYLFNQISTSSLKNVVYFALFFLYKISDTFFYFFFRLLLPISINCNLSREMETISISLI